MSVTPKRIFLFLLLLLCLQFHNVKSQDTAFVRVFGGVGSDEANGLRRLRNQGFVLAGSTGSQGMGQSDGYVVMTDSMGHLVRSMTIGSSGIEVFTAIDTTHDGGLILAGFLNAGMTNGYDGWLVKLDSVGNLEWSRTYGGVDWDFAHAVLVNSDSTYTIAGQTFNSSPGQGDAWLFKVDLAGNTIWEKTYGSAGIDAFYDLWPSFGGGYLCAGMTSPNGDADIYIVKTNSLGDSIWTYISGTDSNDVLNSVTQASDSSVIAAGYTYGWGDTSGGMKDLYLTRLNPQGDSLWTVTNGGPFDDVWHSVKPGTGGKLIITGFTNSTIGFGGDEIIHGSVDTANWFNYLFYHGYPKDERSHEHLVLSDGSIVIGGYTSSHGEGLADVLLLRSNYDGTFLDSSLTTFHDTLAIHHTIVSIKEDGSPFTTINVFPNPTTGRVFFDLEKDLCMVNLYDQKGSLIKSQLLHSGLNEFDMEKLNSGIYIYTITYENGLRGPSGKLIKNSAE